MRWFIFSAVRNGVEITERIPAKDRTIAVMQLKGLGYKDIAILDDLPF